jgi:NADH:ubiquinone oxidoreductase subunit E
MNIEKPLNPTTNEEIIEKWLGKDAPLLPVLHAFHDRDNYLSDESIKFVSDKLKIPIAELYATITFYHHFSRIKVLHQCLVLEDAMKWCL